MITKENIKYMYKRNSGLDGKTSSDFVKFVYKLSDFSIAKDLVNKLVGEFGCKYEIRKRRIYYCIF